MKRTKICKQCSNTFVRNRQFSDEQWRTVYHCSRRCSGLSARTGKSSACQSCGNNFYVPKHRMNTAKYCSHDCYGGETHPDGQGYLRVRGSKKRLHRMLAEEHLGRTLTENEVVHHLNEDKSDNRIENLIILTRGWHLRVHKILAVQKECV